MLNFSRRASTLGWFFPPDSQKVLKIAHFCVSSHIGGVGGVRKHMDPKIQWVMVHGSQNRGSWASWGPTIIFSEKKSPYLNNLSLDHILSQNYFSEPVKTKLLSESFPCGRWSAKRWMRACSDSWFLVFCSNLCKPCDGPHKLEGRMTSLWGVLKMPP